MLNIIRFKILDNRFKEIGKIFHNLEFNIKM